MDNIQYAGPPESIQTGMVSGTWMNKLTGEVVNVRDSIIDGDNMLIITDKGHISMNEFSNNYIQASDTIYDKDGNAIGTQKLNIGELGPMITPKMIEDAKHAKEKFDNEFINVNEFIETDIEEKIEKKQKNEKIVDKKIEEHNKDLYDIDKKLEEHNKDWYIIDKVFSKINIKPDITIDINWQDFPKTQINTLIDFLDININDISSYIIEKYINDNVILDCVKNNLYDHLNISNTQEK